jgi:beta-N-acetylhexosaminidase
MAKDLQSEIGQLFMAGMPGKSLDENTVSLVREFNVGGIILFSRNIEDPVQLAGLARDLQREALRAWGVPLFLAVDQEGGRVARLREPFTAFPGNAAIAESKEPEKRAEEFGTVTAREMNLVGLNMNLAPVVDVQKGELEKHLQGRTFGKNPEQVALLGRTVVRSLQENGVMAVAKHFPGLGEAGVDPHVDLPRIDATKEEMAKTNLLPFRAAIDGGVAGIMSSHAVYPALDPGGPATLSRQVLTHLLRETMGFQGLIITDDLDMGAIAAQRPVSEAALLAFQAGADILLICKGQEHVAEGCRLLRDRLARGVIGKERVVQSLKRIEAAKARFLEKRGEISLARVREYFRGRA